MIYYIYNQEELIGFIYNNNTYYYHKNIQGDIIGILDNNYNEIVTYKYDSYGNITNIIDNSNINLGEINPFRYRSYYYDTETNLYYLNARYYNPEWGRFINADSSIAANNDLISQNLFQYVSNNPIMYSDPSGKIFDKIKQKIFWNKVVEALAVLGLKYSSAFLKNATKKGKDLHYKENSDLSKKINNDKDFQNYMLDVLLTADKNGNINYQSGNKKNPAIKFESDLDLFGSLHGANVNVQGNVNNGYLKVTLTDFYDFKTEIIEGDALKKAVMMGNNLAVISQDDKVLKNYNITIDIHYEINGKGCPYEI